jgi:hypothetical protein
VTARVDAAGWDAPIGRVTDRALTLAAAVDDASKAALLLGEHARLYHVEPLGLFAGARYRLAGVLDHDPGDLIALVALGLVTLAGSTHCRRTPLRRRVGD